MKEFAALLFLVLQAQCDGHTILQMGVTPTALMTICGNTVGCSHVLYETGWYEPMCFMYTTNDVYLIWNPEDIYDQEEPIS